MLVSLFINLPLSFFARLDLDCLKALLAASAHIEAKFKPKVDVEDCKFLLFIECITFHSMISA